LLAYVVQDVAGNNFTLPTTGSWVSLDKISSAAPDGETAELFEVKSATGSETYDWDSNTTGYGLVIVVAFSGRHATDAAVFQPTNDTNSNATPVSVALAGVTAPANADVAWFASLDKTSLNGLWGVSGLGGYTERYDTETDTTWVLGSLWTADNQTGATGTLTATATRASGSGNTGFNGYVVAIPAAGGGGGSTRRSLTLLGVG